MRLQDQHPFDSAIAGFANQYVVGPDGNFYINSPAIMAEDKTICTGETYILISHPNGKNGKMYPVELLDAYYEDGTVNLIVHDLISQRTYKINQCLECAENQCRWMLFDMFNLNKLLDYKMIKSYCGKC
jgi:hypothetical protein